MGLFNAIGNGLSGLFGEGFDDRIARAGALIEGDYVGAAQIGANARKRKDDEAKDAADQEIRQRAYAFFKSKGLDDNAAATLANDPAVAAHAVRDRTTLQTQSYYDPVDNSSHYAPSERVIDDAIIRTDANGKTEALYESPYAKIIPGPDGSFNEQPRVGVEGLNRGGLSGAMDAPGVISESGATGDRAPIPVRSKAQRDALPPGTRYIAPDGSIKIKQGGPSPGGSGGFPF